MKNKKGFVFIETMIVIVVLITALLVLYSAYTGLLTIERRKARYDDPAFIYKTSTLGEFIMNIKFEDGENIISKRMNEENFSISVINYNDQDLFNPSNQNIAGQKEFFHSLYDQFNVQDIKLINSNSIKEENINAFGSDLYQYLKTFEKSNDIYYIVVSYAEKASGDRCDPNQLIGFVNQQDIVKSTNKEGKCTFYYSSLKISQEDGESNE